MNLVERFDQMLKTREVYYFDVSEFEKIAIHYIKEGDRMTALTVIKYGLNQHPNNEDLLILKVDVLMEQQKFDQAERLVKHLIHLSPKDEQYQLQLALIYSFQNKKTQCIELFNTLLNSTDLDVQYEATINLGLEYYKYEDYQTAQSFLFDSFQGNPSDIDLLEKYIYCQIVNHKVDQAITDITLFLDTNPHHVYGWQSLSKLMSLVEEYDLALQTIEHALRLKPNDRKSYKIKGSVLQKSNDFQSAILAFEKALDLGGKTHPIHRKIAHCYLGLSQKWKACKYLSLPIQSGSQNDKNWKDLLHFFIDEKLYDRARDYLESYCKFESENPNFWKLCAQIYLHFKEIEKIDMCLETYLLFTKPKVSKWIYCAHIWIELEQWNKTLQLLFESNDLFGYNKEVEQLIRLSMLQYDQTIPHRKN
ncbi:MAG: tetratricopeptide repeat protein [Flavobacteriaceae bacterium]|nr:tetratricopeptide repeat protein [Flavobacteriaceae bacterium]MCY4267401.1 tetratricopeptide repeat protein [Flavobacteriaceae bacterium]